VFALNPMRQLPTATYFDAEVTQEIADAVDIALECEEGSWDEVRSGEERRSPMFEFCRSLRACRHFANLGATAALSLLRLSLNRSAHGTLAELLSIHDDPDASFLAVWDRVVNPGTFEYAVALARRRPVELKDSEFVSAKFADFISICAHLQSLSREAPIIVPVTKFGEQLGVSARMVTTYRRIAEQRGAQVGCGGCSRRAEGCEVLVQPTGASMTVWTALRVLMEKTVRTARRVRTEGKIRTAKTARRVRTEGKVGTEPIEEKVRTGAQRLKSRRCNTAQNCP
jgi:hypothetical protein